MSILVVEGKPDNDACITACLTADHEVEKAFDAEEGFAKVLCFKPDLVIIDAAVPMDPARSLMQAIRQHPELGATPIMVLGGRTDASTRLALLCQGAQDYATTPISTVDLRMRASHLVAKKHADDRVREAEAKYRGVISIASDAIISVDDTQHIVLFNEGAQAIFGWCAQEVLGKPLDMLLPQDLRSIHRKHVQAFAQGTVSARRMASMRPQIYGLRKNGEKFPAEAAISKLHMHGKTLFTVILRDITERQRREQAQEFLAEAGANLGTTLDSKELLLQIARLALRYFADLVAVDVVDEAGIPARLKVLHADPSKDYLCRLFECRPLKQPGLARTVRETQRSILVSEVTDDFISQLSLSPEHLQGLRELDPRSIMVVPITLNRRLMGTLAFLSSQRHYDAEDLRVTEELARRAAFALENARLYEAAQLATSARDEILSVVAHDLRNPLTAIMLAADRMQHPGARSKLEGVRAARTIRRAAHRMESMIADLLDVGRVASGRLVLAPQRIALDRFLHDTVASQQVLATALSLKLIVSTAPIQSLVWADADRLQRVLENLISNAIKFTPPDGEISVGLYDNGDHSLFWVKDTGAGIPSEQMSHLFDRFWQGRTSDRRGAGLGLYIAKAIVEAHHGELWADSVVGEGSTFYFTLPYR